MESGARSLPKTLRQHRCQADSDVREVNGRQRAGGRSAPEARLAMKIMAAVPAAQSRVRPSSSRKTHMLGCTNPPL